MSARTHQRAAAMLAAIIMVALAAVIATSVSFNSNLFARRSIGMMSQAQALRFAAGAEAIALYALREDGGANNTDSLDETWAVTYGPAELAPGVLLEAALEDLQGRFNINNLITEQGVADQVAGEHFEALLGLLGLEARWRGLITDWIDSDDVASFPDGGEDGAYLAQSPAYRVPNMPISSTSELLALSGMTREIYLKLTPHITALPPGRAVNLCTASAAVLDAVLGQQAYTLDEAGLVKQRESGCFPTLATYMNNLDAAQQARLMDRIQERSEYFRLRSWITIGTVRSTLYSLIQRRGTSGQQPGNMQLRVILRTSGTD